MARLNFNAIFRRYPDGSLEPLQKIRIGGVSFGPGVRFNRGVSFAGIDFTLFENRDFEVVTDGDILVIKGIY